MKWRLGLGAFAWTVCAAWILVSGCTRKRDTEQRARPADIRVGLVYDMGSKRDRSFNEAAFKGLSQAVEQFEIETQEVEPTRPLDREEGIRVLAEEGYSLVVGVGFAFVDILNDVAPQYPEVLFACVDGRVEGHPNVVSLLFHEEEGSYLVGALAAMKTRSDKVGFIGGMDIPLVRKFEAGYRAGIRSVNPNLEVLSDYAGVTLSAFNDPVRGKELALAQYDQGADIIYQAAGGTGLGVIDAARERDRWVIGTDANQNYMAPGNVLTSMVKRVDVAVFETIKSVVEGTFSGGVKEFDLSNGGVDFSVDQYNRHLIDEETANVLEEAKREIISKKRNVPETLNAP